MEKIDHEYICSNLAILTGIPVRVYTGDTLVSYHSSVRLIKDPVTPYLTELREIKKSIGYVSGEDFSFFCILNHMGISIIIGPVRQVPFTKSEIHRMAFALDIPKEELEGFSSGIHNINPMPLETVLQVLCTANYVLNGEKLNLEDIEIQNGKQERLRRIAENKKADQSREDNNPTVKPHNTMAVEQTLTNIVSHGDVAALKRWLKSAPAVRGGTLAAEQLRQRKNMFIVTATLASRAAIRGGLDADTALSLSDGFISSCEIMTSPNDISNLQYHMVLEYTERVERVRQGNKPSRLSLSVANYVQKHISETISAEKLSKELFMSRPYLSKKFHEETGETLTDFILKEKTEEAKRLLRYTDKTASQIGIYLGFSSAAHFSRVFKKYSGMTPGEYKDRHIAI